LREIVGSDLLATVAGAHHAAPLSADLFLLFLQLYFVKSRAQHALGFGAILDLRFLILAGDNQPRRQVRDAHSGVSRIDALSAWPRGTERVNADVLRIDLDLDFVRFRKNGDRYGGGMNASLLFGRRDTLHAMNAAFVFELAIDLVAVDQRDDFLEPAD